jgi:hypothetical protein
VYHPKESIKHRYIVSHVLNLSVALDSLTAVTHFTFDGSSECAINAHPPSYKILYTYGGEYKIFRNDAVKITILTTQPV